jgi:hypothetical protein
MESKYLMPMSKLGTKKLKVMQAQVLINFELAFFTLRKYNILDGYLNC